MTKENESMGKNAIGAFMQAYAVLSAINRDLAAVQHTLGDLSRTVKPYHLDLLRMSVSEIHSRMCELVDRMKDDVMVEGEE